MSCEVSSADFSVLITHMEIIHAFSHLLRKVHCVPCLYPQFSVQHSGGGEPKLIGHPSPFEDLEG